MTPVLGNILQPLIDFFHWFLELFHDDLGLSWGWSIIALTLLVRAVLLPVTYKSSKSMIRLQQLAPQMKSMQKKYKEDPQRLQQETMKFYRENSVNPFASCLPMVAQLPVFLSLYYMLRVDLRHDICPAINPISGANPKPCGETADSSFLFIPDLTDKATGWVLREVGRKHCGRLIAFLDAHAALMPRVMLRNAIEHFDPEERQHYLGRAKVAR